MRKLILGGLVAITLTAASIAIFIGCKKESAPQKEEISSVSQQKYLHGRWDDFTMTTSSFSNNMPDVIISGDSRVLMCTTTVVGRFYNFVTGTYTEYVVSMDVYPCGMNSTTNTVSVNFNTRINPDILADPIALINMDYSDVDNFVFYVDNNLVTPTFSYEKPFEFDVITDEDETITVTGYINVTYDNVISLWTTLTEQGIWHK